MELRDYLNVIRARRGVIILATVIVAAVALAVSLLQAPTYEAEARVLISEKDTGAALFGTVLPELSSQPERALQTQVQLVEVRPVAEETIRELGLEESPDQLIKRVTVGAIGQTNVISIKAQAGSAEEASKIANTMAAKYVQASQERKRASIKEAADEVEQRLGQARTEILELGRRIQGSGKSDELTAELELLTGTYTTLAEKLEQLRINERLEAGSGVVVQPAVIDASPVSPRPLRNLLLGLVVGAVLGLAMAILYEYLDDTIKANEEAERAFQAPVLGTIPSDKVDKGTKRRLAITEAPGSSTAEAYRVLRNSVDFINFEHDLKTLLVTSAAPAEGKSTVAANLAAALAQAGKKVVLVSVDFRRPTTEQFFSINNVIGLSDVLLGSHSLKAALQQPGSEQLLVLNSGKMPPNPSELLGSEKMREVVDSLEEWADWVIMDAPPMLAVADPAAVARWADGVLMVSKAGESSRDNARKATELLKKVGAKTVGVIVWGLDEARGGYGYGKYAGGYYYYTSYYGVPSYQKSQGSSDGRASSKNGWEAPHLSGGRRFALALGKLLTGVLAFLAVLAIAAVVVYFLSRYFGWDIGGFITDFLPR